MKRKGFSTTIMVIITTTALAGALLTTFIGEMSEQTEDEFEEFERNMTEYQRTATLDEDPSVADSQIRDLTWFVTLRGEHCMALLNYILQEPATAMDDDDLDDLLEDADAENATENLNDEFYHMIHIDYAEVRRMTCEAEEQQIDFVALTHDIEQVAEMIEDTGLLDIAWNFVWGGITSIVSGIWSGITTIGSMAECGVREVAGYVGIGDGCEEEEEYPYQPTVWEEDEANDMEGRFGNLQIEYEGDEPVIVDALDPVKRHAVQDVPQFLFTEGALKYGEDGIENDYTDVDVEHYYWTDNNIHFAPDVRALYYHTNGDTIHSSTLEISAEQVTTAQLRTNCRLYPSSEYVPYMQNVPLVVEEELEAGEAGGSQSYFFGARDAGGSSATTEVGAENQYEACDPPFDELDVPSGGDPDYDKDDDFEGRSGNDMPWTDGSDLKDYSFVICPGINGRIQANKGVPGNSGESTEHRFGYEHHHLVYPFVEFAPETAKECMTTNDRFNAGESYSSFFSPSYRMNPDSSSCDTNNLGEIEEIEYWDNNDNTYRTQEFTCGVDKRTLTIDVTGADHQIEMDYYVTEPQRYTEGT